jgi:hypothetical protein
MRNDNDVPPPSDNQTPLDKAFSIFVQESRRRDGNYVGDLVKENLQGFLNQGYSPQEASDALYNLAAQRRRR